MDTKFVDPANAIRIKIMTPLTHQLHRPLDQNRLVTKPKKRKAKAPSKPRKAPKKKPKKNIIRTALKRMTDKKFGFKNNQQPRIRVDFSDIIVKGIPGNMRVSNAPGQINPGNEPRAAEARPANTLELGRAYRQGLRDRGSSRQTRFAPRLPNLNSPPPGFSQGGTIIPARGGNVSGRSTMQNLGLASETDVSLPRGGYITPVAGGERRATPRRMFASDGSGLSSSEEDF